MSREQHAEYASHVWKRERIREKRGYAARGEGLELLAEGIDQAAACCS